MKITTKIIIKLIVFLILFVPLAKIVPIFLLPPLSILHKIDELFTREGVMQKSSLEVSSHTTDIKKIDVYEQEVGDTVKFYCRECKAFLFQHPKPTTPPYTYWDLVTLCDVFLAKSQVPNKLNSAELFTFSIKYAEDKDSVRINFFIDSKHKYCGARDEILFERLNYKELMVFVNEKVIPEMGKYNFSQSVLFQNIMKKLIDDGDKKALERVRRYANGNFEPDFDLFIYEEITDPALKKELTDTAIDALTYWKISW